MIIPEEFKRLAEYFYQCSDKEYSTSDEWIAATVNYLDAQQKAVVWRFLTELLEQNPTADKIDRLWDMAGSDYILGFACRKSATCWR